jgi:hypothetical protein
MRKCLILFVITLLSLCGKTHGFEIKGLQPVDPYGVFSTFSADSLSKGKVAVSTGAEISVDPDFYRLLFKTAYGIIDNVELNMTIPFVFGSASVDAFEDISLGFKHRFFEEGKYGPSLAYIITASIPSGRDEISTNGRYGAGFIMSKRVGPVNGHINLFYLEPGTGQLDEEISLLAGLDFAAAHNFKILAELYCKKSHESEKIDMIEGRFGYRIKTTDFIYTTLGAGFDFKNRNPESRIMFFVTFLSPPEKKEVKKIYEEEQ